LVDNELKMTSIEAVAAKFEVLSWHLPGGTEENHGMPQSAAMFCLTIQAKHSKKSRNNNNFPD
jgi:hypothetical protein